MSVLVSDRTESKFEAITYSIELHDMLIDFMQRSFGVKDLDQLDHIHQIAEEYGIHINKKKTRIVKISSTYKFLQIKYSLTDSGKVIKRINPKRVTTMRRKLKKLAVKVKNEEITYENVENMFRGWMGSFYKLLSKEQRKNLIGLYEDLFEKSITIISKRMIITDKIK